MKKIKILSEKEVWQIVAEARDPNSNSLGATMCKINNEIRNSTTGPMHLMKPERRVEEKIISARITFWDRVKGLWLVLFEKKQKENRPDGFHIQDEI
jgi:hypothetical protein